MLPHAAADRVLDEATAPPVADRIVGGILHSYADAGVEIDGAVAPADVAPADVEEAARRELELLARVPFGPGRPQLLIGLEAAAVTDRRHRRLIHRDQHVLARVAAVTELGDPHPPEQAERAQGALALVTILAAERRTRPEL